jgi:glyoxylase-like metal-dependent hydrolase (beta-lactamase superfamily II)
VPWAEVLVCGDYLSPVEIPMISDHSGGTLEAYRETLFRLSPLVNRAATVIPGHGAPLTSERALEILAEDLAYLDALAAGGEVTVPGARRSATQKQIHERNVASLSSS